MENKSIKISVHGGEVIIDQEDFNKVSAFRWYINKRGYAANDSKPRKLLHRFLLNPPAGNQVDHINSNKLDCRKSNMRYATSQENSLNKKYRGTKSNFKGVYWDKARKRWLASIQHKNEQINLGRFTNLFAAISIRVKKESELFGKFANKAEIEKFERLLDKRLAKTVAFIGQGKNVSEEVKAEINKWTQFIITGK